MSPLRAALVASLLIACSAERAPEPVAHSESAISGGPWRIISDSPPQLESHTTTTLSDTKLLLIGGLNGLGLPSDRMFLLTFDPAKHDVTTSAGGKLTEPRYAHTTTALKNGKLLVVGGEDVARATAELVDPMAGTSVAVAAMSTPRVRHVATLLADGRVLVAGGLLGGTNEVSSSELFDPATNTWSAGPALSNGHSFATATTLADGRVLLAGGPRGGSQVFDPTARTFERTGNLIEPRVGHVAVLLPSGKVLVAGGFVKPPPGAEVTKSAEVFDPATRTWTKVADMPTPRGNATATLLKNGVVMVAGGRVELTPLNYVDFFDEKTGKWQSGSPMFLPHAVHTANAMSNGDVVVMGSSNSEVFAPVETGRACLQSPDCAGNFCVDGVCCATACTGECERCDTSAARGTCTAVSGAFNHCAAGDTCIQNKCVASAGTTCAEGKLAVVDRTGKTTSCAPFICDNSVGVCLDACTTSVECAPGNVCDPASKQCNAAPAAASEDGGCSAAPGAPGSFAIALGLLLSAAALRMRRDKR